MAVTIRPYQKSDLPECLRLGHLMHQESFYRFMHYSDDKSERLLDLSNEQPETYFCRVAAEDDGRLIGFFYSIRSPYFFSDEYVATDLFLYVEPDKRGSSVGVRFIKEYVKWAEDLGTAFIALGVTTEINTDRTAQLFERLGFKHGGHLYRKPRNV